MGSELVCQSSGPRWRLLAVLLLLPAACAMPAATPAPGSPAWPAASGAATSNLDPMAGLHFLPAAAAPLEAPFVVERDAPPRLVLSRNAERLMAPAAQGGNAEGQEVLRGAIAMLRRQYSGLTLAANLAETRYTATTFVLDLRDTTPPGGWAAAKLTLVALDTRSLPGTRIEAGSASPRGFKAAGVQALRVFEDRITRILR